MRVDTIELLRCPRAHETTPLITVAHRRDGDQLLEATLGCPVCGAEFELREGALYLSAAPVVSASEDVDAHRTAALLNVAEPGLRVMLCGRYGAASWPIAQSTEAQAVAVNSERPTAYATDEPLVDVLYCERDQAIPFADASLHAIAIDDPHRQWLVDATRVVRVGGRILANANAPVPNGCRELARDTQEWIAEVESVASTPVELRRRESTSS